MWSSLSCDLVCHVITICLHYIYHIMCQRQEVWWCWWGFYPLNGSINKWCIFPPSLLRRQIGTGTLWSITVPLCNILLHQPLRSTCMYGGGGLRWDHEEFDIACPGKLSIFKSTFFLLSLLAVSAFNFIPPENENYTTLPPLFQKTPVARRQPLLFCIRMLVLWNMFLAHTYTVITTSVT